MVHPSGGQLDKIFIIASLHKEVWAKAATVSFVKIGEGLEGLNCIGFACIVHQDLLSLLDNLLQVLVSNSTAVPKWKQLDFLLFGLLEQDHIGGMLGEANHGIILGNVLLVGLHQQSIHFHLLHFFQNTVIVMRKPLNAKLLVMEGLTLFLCGLPFLQSIQAL